MSHHTFNLFKDACWLAVQVDVEAFQVLYFKSLKGEVMRYPHTNTVITPENATTECLNLETMVRRFITKYQIEETVNYVIEQGRQHLADAELVTRWRNHFILYAQLRLIFKAEAVWYEPSDVALADRAAIRQDMMAQGWRFGGNPR